MNDQTIFALSSGSGKAGIAIIRISGNRKEELLVDKNTLSKMWVLRRILNPMGIVDSMEFLLDKLKESKNNDDFFESMNT